MKPITEIVSAWIVADQANGMRHESPNPKYYRDWELAEENLAYWLDQLLLGTSTGPAAVLDKNPK